jgi:hypothetical protein
MRAMWCTVIALCLVAAGAQPHRAQRSRDNTSTLRVAAAPSAVAARRSTTTPHIGAYIAPDAIVAPAPHRQLVASVIVAPHAALVSQARSARSSRGPPHV